MVENPIHTQSYPTYTHTGMEPNTASMVGGGTELEPESDPYTPYLTSILSTKMKLHFKEWVNHSSVSRGGSVSVSEGLRSFAAYLESKLQRLVSSKCLEQGYICPQGIQLIQHSAGDIQHEYIVYHVTYQCQVAHPAEGQILRAKIRTLTIAGIHAEVEDAFGNIPVTVFVAHDHMVFGSGSGGTGSASSATYKEGQAIFVKVLGTRYELNDPCVYVIAEVTKEIDPKFLKQASKRPKPNPSVGVVGTPTPKDKTQEDGTDVILGEV